MPGTRRRRDPVIASAARMDGAVKTPEAKRRKMPWQSRVWHYYDTIGEVRDACQFYARMLSKIVVYPALLPPASDPDGDPIPIVKGMVDPETVEYDSDGIAIEGSGTPLEGVDAIIDAWAEVQDPGGGRRTLQQRYGQCMFVSGDGFLACSWQKNPSDPQGLPIKMWEFLSNEEIDDSDDKVIKRKRALASGGTASSESYTYPADPDNPQVEEMLLFRVWRPHPRFSNDADSPLRANSDVCESLILLAADERATARSRLVRGGILFIPDEMSDPATSLEPLSEADAQLDPWLREVAQHFITAIENEGAVSSFIPIVIRGPAEFGDKIRRIDFSGGPNAYPASEKRVEAVTRLAMGLDMPPEEMLGKADSNHWSGWLVSREAWQNNGQPVTEQMVQDFTVAYYHPALLAAPLPPELVDRVTLWYDAERVVGNPDSAAAADAAHDRGAISDKAYRTSRGFGDDDAPSETTPNTNPKVIGVPRYTSTDGGVPQPDVGGGGGGEQAPADPSNVSQEPPNGGEAPARILGASEAALLRCRELAGTRLKSRLQDSPIKDPGGPKHKYAAALGPDQVKRLKGQVDEVTLVAGGTDGLMALLARWEVPTGMAMRIASMVERHAADTLYELDPEPLPPELYWQ